MPALRNPTFRRILAGWTVSSIGDSALFLSLGIWAKDLTGSNTAAGLTFLALALPTLAAPLLGQLVDRFRRRPLLLVVNASAGAGVLGLLAVRDRGGLWFLYVVAVGYGVVGVITTAAQSGLLKDAMPGDELDTANAALSTVDQGSRLISPLLGAGLYTAYGGRALAVMAAATFALAVLILATLRLDESPAEPAPGGEGYRRSLTAGFRHIRATPALRRIVYSLAVAMAVLGFYEPVLFAVVDEGLGRPPEFFGVLLSLQGGGSVLGGLSSPLLLRRLRAGRAVGVALAGMAVASLTLQTRSVPTVIGGMVLMGAAVPWFAVAMVTTRQRLTPSRLQGRAAAATGLMLQCPQLASLAVGSVLVGVLDYRWLAAAATVVMAGPALLLLVRPEPPPAPAAAATKAESEPPSGRA